MTHRFHLRFCVLALSLWIGMVCPVAGTRAVSTRQFLLDDAESLGAGDLEGTAVHSDGSVTPSVETRRLALDDVAVARCLLRAPDGTVFVGTGNDGKIYRLRGDDIELFAETGQLLVTGLALDGSGKLFAGTLPAGKIFAVDGQGKVEDFATPEGAEHVWSLVFDPRRNTLFAATGPEGKVFAIDRGGKAEVYYDAKAAHVMALALDANGVLYAGTSDEALVLRLRGPGRAEVVYDFPGNEITALAIASGHIAVAANEFPKPRKVPKKGDTKPKPDDDKKSSSSAKSTASKRPKEGKGQLWRIGADGRAERLLVLEKGHLTALQWAEDGALYAASGSDGRIYRVVSRDQHAVWIDVDERQVLDMDLSRPSPLFVTADAGAVYRVVSGPAQKAIWNSKALDAEFQARWGRLIWRGQGPMSFQTRSGNTDKPDSTWSEWSSPLTRPALVRSPAARFLQVRARLKGGTDTVIHAVGVYYLPQNQRATVSQIQVVPKTKNKLSRSTSKSSSDKADTETEIPEPTSVYEIKWTVDNPDGDELRYRLSYRAEGQDLWRQILRETEILKEKKYRWETDGVADGYYRIRVEASDELANPSRSALLMSAESEPVLIDNHPPRVDELRMAGGRLQGRARDDQGPIAKLEYAVDAHEWMLFFPADDLFDAAEETFNLKLEDLTPGPHIVAVRATDSAGNTASAELSIRR